jgi:predicted SAM-dependent methyltransferase
MEIEGLSVQPTVLSYTRKSMYDYCRGIALHLLRKKGQWERGKVITNYLHMTAVPKLHVGAGPNQLNGWLNTDLRPNLPGMIFLDATDRFPFPDRSFRYVFSEHLIEHISYGHGQLMLRECRRILQADGALRIATPNLLKLVEPFDTNRSAAADRWIQWALKFNDLPASDNPACFVLNTYMRNWGHTFLYDPCTLRNAVEEAGFRHVMCSAPGESSDPNLRGLEHHGDSIGTENNLFETMVLEARC